MLATMNGILDTLRSVDWSSPVEKAQNLSLTSRRIAYAVSGVAIGLLSQMAASEESYVPSFGSAVAAVAALELLRRGCLTVAEYSGSLLAESMQEVSHATTKTTTDVGVQTERRFDLVEVAYGGSFNCIDRIQTFCNLVFLNKSEIIQPQRFQLLRELGLHEPERLQAFCELHLTEKEAFKMFIAWHNVRSQISFDEFFDQIAYLVSPRCRIGPSMYHKTYNLKTGERYTARNVNYLNSVYAWSIYYSSEISLSKYFELIACLAKSSPYADFIDLLESGTLNIQDPLAHLNEASPTEQAELPTENCVLV